MDIDPEIEHPAISQLGGVRIFSDSTVCRDLDIPTEQGIKRLPKMSELEVSVVCGLEGDLGSAVADFDALKGSVRFHFSDLYEEGVDSEISPLRYKPREKNTVSG